MSGRRLRRRPLSVREILSWADAYREATGAWPSKDCGGIPRARFETWSAVDQALAGGLRGLPGGSSLAQLLAEHRGARNVQRLPPLTRAQILHWADEHHLRTGRWPNLKSGTIPGTASEQWRNIDQALRKGLRGLSGSSSLARLLAEHRGARNRHQPPRLTEKKILEWADLHFRRTGTWPTAKAGPVRDAPGETWMAVQSALANGQRGLPGGSSLALLLAARRDVRNPWTLPDLTIGQILVWADAFHRLTGRWPSLRSGSIREAPEETWNAVDKALKRGSRGLPGGSSLGGLLAVERCVRNRVSVPNLRREQILAWADACRRRSCTWPTAKSGPIPEAPAETWAGIEAALYQGGRGLRGCSSLARLLAQHRRHKNRLDQPDLSQKKILRWADGHFQCTGTWPHTGSGQVIEAPGERWDLIDNALRIGNRGLPGGSSLLKLLIRKRGVRDRLRPPRLTVEQIVEWAERHHDATGSWPFSTSGPVADASGETWAAIETALRQGKRGLPGGSSLARLLAGFREREREKEIAPRNRPCSHENAGNGP